MSKKSTAWAPLTTIRPEKSGGVLLKCAWNGKKMVVNADAIVDCLRVDAGGMPPNDTTLTVLDAFRGEGALTQDIDAMELAYARHWWSRSWHPSLSQYMWSQQSTAFDSVVEGDTACDEGREVCVDQTELPPPPKRLIPEGKKIDLPDATPAAHSALEAVLKRRSRRAFLDQPMSVGELSGLLRDGLPGHHETWVLEPSESLCFLAHPMASFDVYVAAFDIDGLDPGYYFYSPKDHALVLVAQGEYREEVRRLIMGVDAPDTASLTIFITADFPRFQWQYCDETGLRRLYMLVGRLGQHLLVAGERWNLGGVVTPAVKESATCDALKLDPVRQAPVYTVTLGKYDAEL